MSTIAELLGHSALGDTLREHSETQEQEQSESAAALTHEGDNSVTETVRSVICEVLGSDMDLTLDELTLRGDLDCDTLELYAVVSRIERECGISIPDALISQCHTLGDLLSAVRTAVGDPSLV